jgi:hypothetical protein
MEHPDLEKLDKLLQKIMVEDPEPVLSPDEVVFKVEVMISVEMVGDWVVSLN